MTASNLGGGSGYQDRSIARPSCETSIVAKATVTAALGLVGAWLARGSRAAVRHALLAAAFGALLALPVASIVAVPVRIAVPAVAQEPILPALAGGVGSVPPLEPARPSVGVTPVVPRSAGFSPSALLLAGWIAGMALFLLPVIMGLSKASVGEHRVASRKTARMPS